MECEGLRLSSPVTRAHDVFANYGNTAPPITPIVPVPPVTPAAPQRTAGERVRWANRPIVQPNPQPRDLPPHLQHPPVANPPGGHPDTSDSSTSSPSMPQPPQPPRTPPK